MSQNTLDNLPALLHAGVVELVFTKADGSTRHMKASLTAAALASAPPVKGTGKPTPPDMLKVVDTEIGQFRSVKLDSVISINGEKIGMAGVDGTVPSST